MKKTENKKTKVKGKKRPFFTISKKILALSLLPMIIVCALVATVGSRALEAGIEKQIEKALQIVGVSVDETYTHKTSPGFCVLFQYSRKFPDLLPFYV